MASCRRSDELVVAGTSCGSSTIGGTAPTSPTSAPVSPEVAAPTDPAITAPLQASFDHGNFPADATTLDMCSLIADSGSEQIEIEPAIDAPCIPVEVRSLTDGAVNVHLASNEQPTAPVLVSYTFDPGDLRDGESPVILHYDEVTATWHRETTFVDSSKNEAFAYVTHLT
jgi:hypothetical protein